MIYIIFVNMNTSPGTFRERPGGVGCLSFII